MYTLLQQDDKAPVIEFGISSRCNILITPLYGYVIFQPSPKLFQGGLIIEVIKQCLIMVEQNSYSVFLSISYPDLNLNVDGDTKTSHTKSIRRSSMN